MDNSKIEISDEELNSLTNAIKNRYALDFTNYEPKSLKRGFARLIMRKKMGSVLGLWSKILKDREFFLGCIDDLTVNLTELFRNPEIWIQLKNEVLPTYKNNINLKMWHAGCSSGEEVYTTAIVLKELDILKKTKTLATDLSSTILAQAIEGKYPIILMNKYKSSFSNYLSKANFNDSFLFDDHYARVKDDLKKHIDFKQHNLAQDGMDQTFDIIFCRNVMIYFDDKLKMKVLNLFYENLKNDGYFIIGYYDMLPEASKELFKPFDSKTRIYKKIVKNE
ncbi:MAG: hypothetical protein A3K10_13705 [Bacteroidetes bacterium RIFCSPLOWO2_12_FULL_31_6]|nr:MAG: hypothetical protein A3K10_13705 [Bacteroidetes bacterium RIFCSPLOWO2_12_FULL_31_6]